jgi:hypothetical protein
MIKLSYTFEVKQDSRIFLSDGSAQDYKDSLLPHLYTTLEHYKLRGCNNESLLGLQGGVNMLETIIDFIESY